MSDTPGSLREQQLQVTRERLMEAMLALLVEGGAAHLAIADVAAKANISVRTAYRHFPSSDALLDAFNDWARDRFLPVAPPKDADGYAEFAERIARSYAGLVPHLKAMRASGAGAAVQGRRRKAQSKQVEATLAPKLAHLDDVERKRAMAVLHLLGSSDAFLFLHDNWDADDAAATMRWAVETLMAAIVSHDKRGKR
jgi:AcrR family transcriptional regulator